MAEMTELNLSSQGERHANKGSQGERYASLCHAVRVNDISAVEGIEDGSEELNEYDDYGYTLLHYAAKYGHLHMLQTLINKSPTLTLVSKNEKYTVLHFLGLQKIEDDEKAAKFKMIVNDLLTNMDLVENVKSNKCIWQLLHLACHSGNITMVTILLSDEQFQDEIRRKHPTSKNTPLHEASLCGHFETVDKLIKKIRGRKSFIDLGDITCQNSNAMSPFHIACLKGHTNIVKIFFECTKTKEREILANDCGKKLKSPLHFACEKGNKDIISMLKINGATLEKNIKGTLPIHVAAKYGHDDIICDLLRDTEGTDINAVDNYGNTPLNIATRYSRKEMIEKLLAAFEANTTIMNKELHTPLICAAIRGNFSAYKALVSNGASITDTDANGRNIIHIAADKNHSEFLEEIFQLKDKKAKIIELINLPDKDLNTPLHLAAERGHVECVKIIISYKEAHLEMENKSKWTPLYCAAERGHHSVIKCLLDQSCRFLFQDEKGNTALHLVCQNGRYEATELLLRSQIGLNRRNHARQTPLDVAAFEGHAKVVKLLLRTLSECHSEKFLNKLVNPQGEKDSKSQKAQLEKKESVERPRSNDTIVEKECQQETDMSEEEQEVDSPLHLAITQGHLEVVKVLVKKEADVKLPNYKTGKTPLQVAIEHKHEAIAKEFLQGEKNMKEALECKWISETDTTPFKELIKGMPKLAGLVLDRAHVIQEDPPGLNASFKFDFTQKDCDELSEQSNNCHSCCSNNNWDRFHPSKVCGPFVSIETNHPLLVMIKSNRKELLEHNFIKHIRDQKWLKGGMVYILALIAYAIFVIFLTAFALVSPNPQEPSCEAVMNGTFGQAKSEEIDLNNNSECSKETRIALIVLMVSIWMMIILQILLEIIQFYTYGLWYLKDWNNYLDIVLYISCIIFVSSALNNCACPTKWQWQIGCIAVFLAWIDLLIFLRMAPGGIHILMFEKIFISFWKTILLTSILVVSFSIVFYMQFFTPGQLFIRSPFSTVGRAHIKVMTMTTGELDYDSLFRLYPDGTADSIVEIPFFEISIILWILFLIMMPILLSNLLFPNLTTLLREGNTGLAIDDVKKIRERAAMRSLQLRMEFVLYAQAFLNSYSCRNDWKRKNRWEKPDSDEKHSQWKVSFFINTLFNSDEKEDDSIGSSQEEVMECLKKITSNAEEMKKKMAIMESTLKSSMTETMEKEIKGLKEFFKCSSKEESKKDNL